MQSPERKSAMPPAPRRFVNYHRSVIKSKVSANARKSARRSGRPCFRPKGLKPRVVPPPKRPSDEHLHLARSRTQQVQLTENQSKEMVFGRQLALLQATLQVNIPRSLTYNDAALRRCFANLGLPHHPPYSPQDVERYIDHKTIGSLDDLRLAVYWMNDDNSPGIDSLRPGRNGFAWMFSQGCAAVDLVKVFHLFNAAPCAEDPWKERRWQYCGKYYAHRMNLTMSVDGWKCLPLATRNAAGHIRAKHPKSTIPNHCPQKAREMFERGEIAAELVIFQFCGMPNYDFFDRLNEATALSVRPARRPMSPRAKLDRKTIFAKHGPESVAAYKQIQSKVGKRPHQARQ